MLRVSVICIVFDLEIVYPWKLFYFGPIEAVYKHFLKIPKKCETWELFFHTSTETCFGEKSFHKNIFFSIRTQEKLKKFQGFPPIWSKIVTCG